LKRITEKEHMLVYEDRKIDATRRKPLDQYLRCFGFAARSSDRRPAVGEHLKPSNVGHGKEVRDRLNQKLRGWKAYFGFGSPTRLTKLSISMWRNVSKLGIRKFFEATDLR